MVGSGALNLTTRSLPPSQLFRKRHQGSSNSFNTLGPSIQALQHPPDLHEPGPQASMVANPKAGLGWNWSLGKTAGFAELKAVPPVIPHRSTRLGVQAQRRTVYLAGPQTHTRTGGRPRGPSSNQLRSSPFPLWPHSTRTVPT